LADNVRNIRRTVQDSLQDLDDPGFTLMPFFTKESAFHGSISGEYDASILIPFPFFDSKTWTRNFLCMSIVPSFRPTFEVSELLKYRRTSGPEKEHVVKEISGKSNIKGKLRSFLPHIRNDKAIMRLSCASGFLSAKVDAEMSYSHRADGGSGTTSAVAGAGSGGGVSG
jgi:hypothetical protein